MKRSSMFDLTGQTMFVTGATSGIGRPITVALQIAGAGLVVADVNGERLAEQAGCLKDLFPKVSVQPTSGR